VVQAAVVTLTLVQMVVLVTQVDTLQQKVLQVVQVPAVVEAVVVEHLPLVEQALLLTLAHRLRQTVAVVELAIIVFLLGQVQQQQV
jgi:hypothetical protein